MNLYHKVEAAFDSMADALKAAMNVAENSEETELYSDLSIDIESLHDDAQSLYEKLIQKKNAASAAGTAETAKNDSDKESISSVAENGENVKTPYMNVRYICDGKYDVEIYATSVKELLSIYRAANDGIKGFTEQNCIPFTVVEFLADYINKEE